ncbi:MAG TPA: hypothetical protein VHZ95_13315 [Polyangiales bacterium]|nr:hypothetical protein [Polyangiales bacterium]
MPRRSHRSLIASLLLIASFTSVAGSGGCGPDTLPAFANPPPVDAGDIDHDDAGSEDATHR